MRLYAANELNEATMFEIVIVIACLCLALLAFSRFLCNQKPQLTDRTENFGKPMHTCDLSNTVSRSELIALVNSFAHQETDSRKTIEYLLVENQNLKKELTVLKSEQSKVFSTVNLLSRRLHSSERNFFELQDQLDRLRSRNVPLPVADVEYETLTPALSRASSMKGGVGEKADIDTCTQIIHQNAPVVELLASVKASAIKEDMTAAPSALDVVVEAPVVVVPLAEPKDIVTETILKRPIFFPVESLVNSQMTEIQHWKQMVIDCTLLFGSSSATSRPLFVHRFDSNQEESWNQMCSRYGKLFGCDRSDHEPIIVSRFDNTRKIVEFDKKLTDVEVAQKAEVELKPNQSELKGTKALTSTNSPLRSTSTPTKDEKPSFVTAKTVQRPVGRIISKAVRRCQQGKS